MKNTTDIQVCIPINTTHFYFEDGRRIKDSDYTRLRMLLEKQDFKPIGRELIRDAVELVADDNEFDSAQEWINRLPAWDGTPRVEKFLSTYFGAEDSAYTRAVGQYLWTALAGRVLVPGIQADMALILTGAQGFGKTSGVRAIAPSRDQVIALDFNKLGDKAISPKLRGKLVGELSGLKGFKRRQQARIKSFITRREEVWVPKRRELSTRFPRRAVFIGTTNEDEFLSDEFLSDRRWLPVLTGRVDVAGIDRDRDQLWAEGRAMFLREGVMWKTAEELAPSRLCRGRGAW